MIQHTACIQFCWKPTNHHFNPDKSKLKLGKGSESENKQISFTFTQYLKTIFTKCNF